MKYFLVTILSIINLFVVAQITEGTYMSSNESYRTNYYLVVETNQLTLYGWETTMENDTIYFRSTSLFESNSSVTFKEFEFQKEPFTSGNLLDFKADIALEVESFLLHKYLMNITESNGEISLLATKDIYCSRADNFVFKKIIVKK
jgi:hypothetical protein